MAEQQSRWGQLRKELTAIGIEVIHSAKITKTEKDRLEPEFLNQLFAVLTPLAIDPAHPFPFLPNLGFSLALKLRRHSDNRVLYALCRCRPRCGASGSCRPTDARPRAGGGM